jgi:uncharacterized protein
MTEKHTIQVLLGEFHDKLDKLSGLVSRIARFPDAPNKIKVAIGMRRTGKTYFLYQSILQLLQQKVPLTRILYINFEDDRLLPLDAKKLAGLLEAFYSLYPENHNHKCYLFLDEIQNVEEWHTVIRRFHDSKTVEIFLTGSSAKLLSKEIATSLRGRSLATEIWPYSLNEYMQAKNIEVSSQLFDKKTEDKLTQVFHEYLREGGFPEVVAYSQETRQKTFQEYVDIVIYRDIIERHRISNTALIKYMIVSMIHNAATSFSINKFYNDLKSQGYKISKDILYEYAGYIEDAYLAFSLPLYAESLRKAQVNPKKIDAIDTGIITAMTLNHTGNFGKLLENIVYLDLRRQGYNVHYYLTDQRYEVDFLIENWQGQKKLLQVVWNMEDAKTLAREERALEQAQKELALPGEIITLASYLESRGQIFI